MKRGARTIPPPPQRRNEAKSPTLESDFIEREIRLPAVDIVTKTDKKLQLRVTLEKNRVRVVVVA